MLEFLSQPWPWYIGGPLIGVLYLTLHVFGKGFGISSTLRTACSILGAGRVTSFFRYDWKEDSWNLFFISGLVIGAFLSVQFLTLETGVKISDATQEQLVSLGVKSYDYTMAPSELFSFENIKIQKIILWILGGVLIGFGTRYAGGCTSGHAISGLSNLQLPSLVAVIGFFIGGLIMTYFILEHLIYWAI